MACRRFVVALTAAIGMLVLIAKASTDTGVTDPDDPGSGLEESAGAPRVRWGDTLFYGSKGLQYQSKSSDTDLWLGLRFQSRFDDNPGDIRSADDIVDDDSGLDMRRARIKGGGDLFRDWLHIYAEYDYPSRALLDLRLTVSLTEQLNLRVGQWKSEFNRERVDSSGKQQLVERSIVNSWFTIDRQQGVALSQRFAKGTSADTRVYLEYLSGQGRGAEFDDESGLWLGRVMWNPAGRELPYSQSSLQRYDSPVPSLAIAMVDGETPYALFV